MIHGIRVSSKRRVLGQGVAPHRARVEGLEIAVNESGHDDNTACQKVQMSVMKTKSTATSKVIEDRGRECKTGEMKKHATAPLYEEVE